MSWNERLIGEFVEAGEAIIQTGPFGTQLKASDYTSYGTPVINVRNIGYGDLRPDKLEFVGDQITNRLSVHIIRKNDIVFGRKGAVDRHLFVKTEQDGWMQGSDCIKLRFIADGISQRFISYAFLCNQHKQWMLTQSGNKATMASLNQDIVKRIPIPFPPLPIQQKIATILSAYDDLIENNLRRIKLLEESARLLYREWFVNLRFPGHEHTHIVDDVPEGWKKVLLKDAVQLLMGQSPKSEYYNDTGEGLPFHQGVSDFGLRFVTHKKHCTVSKRIAEGKDILCSVRAPVGRLNITLDKIIIGRGLAALRSKTGNQSLLYYQLKAHFFKEDMIGGGAIFASVTKKQLESQELLSPPNLLVKQFEEISKPIDSQIENLFLQNQKLKAARDLLLPRLMSGELTV